MLLASNMHIGGHLLESFVKAMKKPLVMLGFLVISFRLSNGIFYQGVESTSIPCLQCSSLARQRFSYYSPCTR